MIKRIWHWYKGLFAEDELIITESKLRYALQQVEYLRKYNAELVARNEHLQLTINAMKLSQNMTKVA